MKFLQGRVRRKKQLKRPVNIKIIPAFLGLLSVVFISLFSVFLPKQAFSASTHEALPEFPKFSVKSFLNGTYATSLEKYLNDHIAFRELCLSFSNNFQAAIGVQEINHVFISKQRLIENTVQGSTTISDKNTEAVFQFIKKLSPETECRFALIPTAAGIYGEELPAPVSFDQAEYISRVYQNLPQNCTIDIFSYLNSSKTEQIYYHTDSHWTSQGAYLGYSAILRSFGKTPYVEDLFNIEYASHDFYGDLYQKTHIKTQFPDVINLYHYSKEHPAVEVQKYNGSRAETFNDLYDRSALKTDQQYRVFMGSDAAVINIRQISNNDNYDENLLIFRDSFSDPLIQFLSLHYQNVTLINLSLIQDHQMEKIPFEKYKNILFLYETENYLSDNSIFTKLDTILKNN